MKFKRIEKMLDETRQSTMIRATIVSDAQYAFVQSLIAAHNNDVLFRNKELHSLTQQLTGKKYVPYWIGKNIAVKTKTAGIYDLSKLRSESMNAHESKKLVKRERRSKRESITIDETKLIETRESNNEALGS
jgi:hypothetical protein